MTHYTLESWADFVRGLIDAGEQRRMHEHAQTCSRCREDRRAMEQVAETVTWDSQVEPSAEGLRRAYALSTRLPTPAVGPMRRLLAVLVFDSRTLVALEGVRSIGRGVRQMVFEADPYRVHVQWEHAAPGGPVSLVGRVATTAETTLLSGIVVRAVTPTTVAGETTTNRFGEFVLECPWDPGLALHLPLVSEGVRMEVPLAFATEPSARPRRRGQIE